MHGSQLGDHIFHRFDEELEALRKKVLMTGGLVEDQLDAAIKALLTGDAAQAQQVIDNDTKVNVLEMEIDDDCAQILARRQPMARDLRFVIASIKAVNDLERMGDESRRVAEMAQRLAELGGTTKFSEIRHLGNHVRTMVHDALDSYARADVELAINVLTEDRGVDREYESISRELITLMMEDPRSIPKVLDVQWSARALERIGDRACNICEYVIYFTKGDDVRHIPLDEVVDRARRDS